MYLKFCNSEVSSFPSDQCHVSGGDPGELSLKVTSGLNIETFSGRYVNLAMGPGFTFIVAVAVAKQPEEVPVTL